MTFQEAYIACKDHFGILSGKGKDDINFTPAELKKLDMDCRTRATAALHHIYGNPEGGIYNKDEKALALKALTACARCDYKSPRIAELVEKQF